MEEDEYEAIESLLLMAVGQFERRWEKAWINWRRSHNLTDEDAGEMLNCPYDDDGNTLPEATAWYAIYTAMKTAVENEFNCGITVDGDGDVFAVYKLPADDTITVP